MEPYDPEGAMLSDRQKRGSEAMPPLPETREPAGLVRRLHEWVPLHGAGVVRVEVLGGTRWLHADAETKGDAVQRAVKAAARKAGIAGKVTPHCLRHSFCSDLLDAGPSARRVQEAMGHNDIRTTMGYARKDCLNLPSPIDNLKRRSA